MEMQQSQAEENDSQTVQHASSGVPIPDDSDNANDSDNLLATVDSEKYEPDPLDIKIEMPIEDPDEKVSLLEEEEKKKKQAVRLTLEEEEAEELVDLFNLGVTDDFKFEIPCLKGRPIVETELEQAMHLAPFMSIPLYFGNVRGFLGDTFRHVGKWKGIMRLVDPEREDKKQQQNNAELMQILQPKSLFVRVYILDGTGFAAHDSNGKSDPYLVLKIGKHKVSTRDRYRPKTQAPEFYESFEFPVTLPGDAVLTIESWDWDGIGDDLIGSTEIDIEDRYYTTDWRAFDKVPLETRRLRAPSRTQGQGDLKMFIEILDPEYVKKHPLMDISLPPPCEMELRVIAWQVKDCPAYDSFSGQSDLQVRSLCLDQEQETDIHWRTKTGIGNFNWRLNYKMQFQLTKKPSSWPRLALSVWDKDIIAADDAIGEVTVPLQRLIERALVTNRRSYYARDGEKDFWLHKLKNPKATKESKKGLPSLKVRVEVLPNIVAKAVPAGEGRGEPNQNPFLPEPEGRIMPFDIMHPGQMCKDLLGPEAMKKICCVLVICITLAALYYILPMWLSAELSEAIFPNLGN